MNPNTGRSSIFAVVGGYLLYLSYELLKSLINHEPTVMPQFLQILVIVLFAGAGITLIVFAYIFWKKGRVDQDKNPVELDETESSAADGEDSSEK